MSQRKRENVIKPERIWIWTAADNANINANNIGLIFIKLERVEMKCIFERKQYRFSLKKIDKLKGIKIYF